jgi:hypothetical protein
MSRDARLAGVNPWLRLLGAFAALVLAVLLLKVIHPLVVLVLFVGGVAWVNQLLKTQVRREHQGADAEALGLKRERGDPFGLLGYPFALLLRGRDARVDDVLWGSWQGLDARVFRFTGERPETPDLPRVVLAYVCASAPVDASCPSLSVEPRSFLTPPNEAASMRPVGTDDEDFDRRFDVRCDDPAFARSLLDAPLRSWIASLDDTWGFELSGRLALVYTAVEGGRQVTAVLPVLKGFLDRVPAEVRSPAPAPAPEPRPSAGVPERPDPGAESR